MTKIRIMKKILLGLTTTPGSDWREKIREIDELGIKEVALFPTYLGPQDRKELYKLLENSEIESIPHVHLREEDMEKEEVDYLAERFHTKIFNLHPNRISSASAENLSEYKKSIFLENLNSAKNLEEIAKRVENVGGLCIDYSHWHDRVLKKDSIYDSLMRKLIKNNKIGCCHISVIYDEPQIVAWAIETEPHYSGHYMHKLSDLDYMKNYVTYIPDIASLELENSFKEQLEAKKYIEKIIDSSSKF